MRRVRVRFHCTIFSSSQSVLIVFVWAHFLSSVNSGNPLNICSNALHYYSSLGLRPRFTHSSRLSRSLSQLAPAPSSLVASYNLSAAPSPGEYRRLAELASSYDHIFSIPGLNNERAPTFDAAAFDMPENRSFSMESRRPVR